MTPPPSGTKPFTRILVCCGARPGALPLYMEEAHTLGKGLGEKGYTVVYGGGNRGLMGAVMSAALPAGNEIYGYIPEAFAKFDDVISGVKQETVEDLFDRKKKFLLSCDAGIVLPGGIGTFDEIGEMAAANDLQSYADGSVVMKPIILVNNNGYFDHIMLHFQLCVAQGFMHAEQMKMFMLVDTAEEALALLDELNTKAPQPTIVLQKSQC